MTLTLDAWLHEIIGHAFQVPFSAKKRCAYSSIVTFLEGWASYIDIVISLNLQSLRDQFPYVFLYASNQWRQLTYGGAVVDGWNILYKNVTLDGCIALNMANGYGGYTRSRGRCLRIFGGFQGQQYAYEVGYIALLNARERLIQLTGPNFDSKLYHLVPYHYATLLTGEILDAMVPLLADMMNGDLEIAKHRPYYDLLSNHLLVNPEVFALDFDPLNTCGRATNAAAGTGRRPAVRGSQMPPMRLDRP